MSILGNDKILGIMDVIEKTVDYTHGFEKIYNYQTIDLKSIRPLSTNEVKNESKKEEIRDGDSGDTQLLFRFPNFKLFIDSFTLEEPIAMLRLAPQLQEALHHNGLDTIGDLLLLNLNSFCQLHGIGQGHFEDLKLAVEKCTLGKQLYSVKKIDFGAFIRSTTQSIDQRKLTAMLESLNIYDLIPLSVTDQAEVKRLTPYDRKKWVEEALKEVQNEPTYSRLSQAFQAVTQVFLIPWIRQQGNVVSSSEITERFTRVREGKVSARNFLTFMKTVNGQQDVVPSVGKGLLVSDKPSQEAYFSVKARVESYFYNDTVCYELNHLKSLVSREAAKEWQNIDEKFIDAMLMKDSSFSQFRTEKDVGIRVRLL